MILARIIHTWDLTNRLVSCGYTGDSVTEEWSLLLLLLFFCLVEFGSRETRVTSLTP